MFAADSISRNRRGPDGKTAYERETGREGKKPSIFYDKEVPIQEAVERGPGALQPRGARQRCAGGMRDRFDGDSRPRDGGVLTADCDSTILHINLRARLGLEPLDR